MKKTSFLICLLSLFIPPCSFAGSIDHNQKKKNIGLLIGSTEADFPNSKYEVTYGLSYGRTYLEGDLEIGLNVFSSKVTTVALGKKWFYRDTPVLIKANYRVYDNFRAGLQVGPTDRNLNYEGNDADSYGSTSFSYGTTISYIHELADNFSLGVEAYMLKVGKATQKVKEEGNDVTINFGEVTYTGGLFSFRYHF